MTFSIALIHVGLLGLLVVTAAGLARLHVSVLCRSTATTFPDDAIPEVLYKDDLYKTDTALDGGARGVPSPSTADRALSLWRLLPAIPLLYAGMALGHLGLPGGAWYDILLAFTAWGACWWAARGLVRDAHDPALPIAALALLGVHLGLITEVSRAWTVDGLPNTAWLSSTALMLVFGVLIPGALLRARRDAPGLTPPWLYALSGRDGVRLGLALFGAGALLALWQILTHTPRPVYACAMTAYLLAGTTGVTRCARRPFRHGTFGGFLSRWWPGLALCAVNISLPIATRDFSPAVVLLVTLTVMLWVARERGMAVVLAAVMALGLVGVSRSRLVPRFQERWSLMAHPYAGGSSQMAQTLYAVARGGVFGVGAGNAARIPTARKGLHGMRPAVPLAETDAVLTTLAESTGSVGIGAVLLLFAVLTSGLADAARRARRLWCRLYLTQTASLFFTCALWGAGWSLGAVAPMAGLAVPLLTRGWGAMGLWLPVLLLAVFIAHEGDADADFTADPALEERAPGLTSRLAPIWLPPAVAAGLLLLTVLAALKVATVDRARDLSAVFHNTSEEARIAEWIARGQVRCAADGSLAVSGGSALDRERIGGAVRQHLIRAEHDARGGWVPVPARENLVEVESSGLGTALRATRE